MLGLTRAGAQAHRPTASAAAEARGGSEPAGAQVSSVSARVEGRDGQERAERPPEEKGDVDCRPLDSRRTSAPIAARHRDHEPEGAIEGARSPGLAVDRGNVRAFPWTRHGGATHRGVPDEVGPRGEPNEAKTGPSAACYGRSPALFGGSADENGPLADQSPGSPRGPDEKLVSSPRQGKRVVGFVLLTEGRQPRCTSNSAK